MLLDQLIGFSVGMVMVISSVLIQKYSKELQVNEKY
ncbi:Group-specific protein [Bacillus mycoides]|nr:Group-specific protein [Bacillus mycoides]